MATGILILPIGAAIPTDGTSGFPAVSILTSSDADLPKARCFVAAFDKDNAENLCFGFRLPANYASGGVLKGNFYMDAANSAKNVVWRAAAQAVSPEDSTDVTALDPVNLGTGWQSGAFGAPETAKYMTNFSVDLSSIVAAAGDHVVLIFGREATAVADDAVNDAIVLDELHLEYTT